MITKDAFKASVVKQDSTWSSIRPFMNADKKSGALGGFLVVTDSEEVVVGTITDGDLRKIMEKADSNLDILSAGEIMNSDFIYVFAGMTPKDMGLQVLEQLKKREIKNEFPITYIPVLNREKKLHSLFHISNLLGVLDELTRQIVIFGQGFVGLTLAMAMVKSGLRINAVEKNPEIYMAIRNLRPHVHEPQLFELLSKYLDVRYFITNQELTELKRLPLLGRRTYIIAVGTPKSGQSVDLSQIESAVAEISLSLRFGDLVILRSTVPIGTTRRISEIFREKSGLNAGLDFHIAYAPERTVEGDAIAEVTKLPQLVSGLTEECSKEVSNFFSGWISNVVRMESLEACEMAKLTSNAYRDVTFAFSNELSKIAATYNLDINRLIISANIGYTRNAIPMPSPGVGGPCLTKDSYMLVSDKADSMIHKSRLMNEGMIDFSINRILRLTEKCGDDILIIGAAFKGIPATNDLRNSTSVEIARGLTNESKRVQVIDAIASQSDIEIAELSIYDDVLFRPNVICILNNHPENRIIFRSVLKQVGKKGLRIGVFDPWNTLVESDFLNKNILISTLSKIEVFN